MPDFSLDVGAQYLVTQSTGCSRGWRAGFCAAFSKLSSRARGQDNAQRAATAFYLPPTCTIERDSFEDHGCPLARLGLEAGKL